MRKLERKLIPCACNCGELIMNINRWKKPVKYKKTHVNRGENNGRWKGGIMKKQGYVLVRTEGHPNAEKRGKYVEQHILVMEKCLGRYLTKDEVIHHINGIRDDNRIENLQLVTRSEHATIEWRLRRER